MKTVFLSLVAAGAGLFAGCETSHNPVPVAGQPAPALEAPGASPGVAYDDRLIARIKRGETTEAQLLEWFGVPESRDVRPDGRSHLSWGFGQNSAVEAGSSGTLQASLTPDGTVDAYSARRGSTPRPAALSGTKGALAGGYDDQRIARIKRGVTTEPQLLEWFGPPDQREAKPDGRGDLSWTFGRATDGAAGHAGALYVSLAADGSVDAYSAHGQSRVRQ